jgi:hypothetical protein
MRITWGMSEIATVTRQTRQALSNSGSSIASVAGLAT